MTRLIVNADDFGMTSGINRAIVELHEAGVLTSATLMAQAAATREAIELAVATPSLGVGCHVVFVDGEPVSTMRTRLAPEQRFHPTLGAFLRALFSGAVRAVDIEREACAQLEFLQARGVAITHVDTHKHTHMFPQVLRPLLRAARAFGVRTVRNPFEPRWSVAATPGAPFVRRAQVRMLRALEPGFRRAVAEEGFVTTGGAIGVLATGTLDANTVSALVGAAPEKSTLELVAHPGYDDADLASVRTRLRHSREVERDALLSLRRTSKVKLISFADLETSRETTR